MAKLFNHDSLAMLCKIRMGQFDFMRLTGYMELANLPSII